LLAQDALDMLGLKADATDDEIKQTYRDLVKVWHPDRFANDARLRTKAEEHLKEINAAYRALETGSFDREPPSSPQKPEQSSYQAPPASKSRSRAPHDQTLRFSVYIASALLIAAIAGFAVQALRHNVPGLVVPVPAAQDSTPGPDPVSTTKPSHKAPPRSSDLNSSAKPDFQVWSLPQGETDRLQLACSRHAPGSEAYRHCIKAQLDALRHSRGGAPEMNALSTAERHAAENACAPAKTSSRGSAYHQCLRQQVADVAAEPIRPDLSTLSEEDRNSVQSACSGEGRRGAAEYGRCILRFENTLAGAERSPR
jgi:hypothetical protein